MNIEQLINRVAPFLIIGFTIALSIAVLIFLSSVIFWGVIIGLIMYGVIALKEAFFPSQQLTTRHKHRPRTFEHDDA